MNRTPELISVIIPVHNGALYLAQAVASLERQRGCALEILVVDDGSTDETPRVIRTLGSAVYAVRQPQRGVAAARNRGVRLARGEWIAFLDADDVWDDAKLETQLAYLERYPDVQLLAGRTALISAAPEDKRREQAAPTLPFHLGASLIQRAVFEQLGPFDESLVFGEDLDLFLRAVEQDLRIRLMPEVVYYYRRHTANITNDHRRLRRVWLQVLRRSVERRRINQSTVAPISKRSLRAVTEQLGQ